MRTILHTGTSNTHLATAPRRRLRHGLATLAVLGFGVGVVLAGATPVRTAAATPPAVAAKTTTAAHRAAARALAARRLLARRAPHNIAMVPNVLSSCTTVSISTLCATDELAAINHARAAEGIAPISINLAHFALLSPPQQVFAITDLERSARGLPLFAALTAQLNAAAAIGTAKSTDPALSGWTLAGGKYVTSWASNWAGGLDALGADYIWMYDDGVGYNVDCPKLGAPGCWGHRSNELIAGPSTTSCAVNGAKPELVMGAAVLATGYKGGTGIGELFVTNCGGLPSDATFTWAEAEQQLFG